MTQLTDRETTLLETCKARLASGVIYPSADSYYWDKEMVQELEAKQRGMTFRQANPMGFWYGRQSN